MKTLKEKAQELKEKGSPLTIEELIAFLEKKEAKKAKSAKKSAKRWTKRESDKKIAESTPNIYDGMTMHEINLMNAKNNLPSSMR